jgi:oxygen-independent coproporphyrinogen-3 oxidase|tara:strand:+ start:432 stop:1565 length:1134 start_codon:yes stop_codon:yes gene_type:complete
MLNNPGVYVHFPWCIKKCPYCDFNSHPLKDDVDQQRYLDSLLEDWQDQSASIFAHADNQKALEAGFKTVFFGGGTPSLFRPQLMAKLLQKLPLATDAEVTMEANPGTQEYTNFEHYLGAGINRLSIGAQSFQNSQLAKLGRVHNCDETVAAVAKAKAAGFTNINIDLMWGLPGQTLEDALFDLTSAIALSPQHISWYQLTIEAKTEFAKRPPLLPIDGILAEIENKGNELLEAEGYSRYEISAYARDSAYCQHNINYWSFGDYVGLGAGAHGKISGRPNILRTQKASQPRLYQGEPAKTSYQTVLDEQLPLEFMMNALRLIDGTEQQTFTQTTGLAWQNIEKQWSELVAQGLVKADRCSTTELGLRYLDTVLERFVN